MPTTEKITQKEKNAIEKALDAYLKDNDEISQAIDLMKQVAVRNWGRYSSEPVPYRSIPSE